MWVVHLYKKDLWLKEYLQALDGLHNLMNERCVSRMGPRVEYNSDPGTALAQCAGTERHGAQAQAVFSKLQRWGTKGTAVDLYIRAP